MLSSGEGQGKKDEKDLSDAQQLFAVSFFRYSHLPLSLVRQCICCRIINLYCDGEISRRSWSWNDVSSFMKVTKLRTLFYLRMRSLTPAVSSDATWRGDLSNSSLIVSGDVTLYFLIQWVAAHCCHAHMLAYFCPGRLVGTLVLKSSIIQLIIPVVEVASCPLCSMEQTMISESALIQSWLPCSQRFRWGNHCFPTSVSHRLSSPIEALHPLAPGMELFV